MTDLKTLREDVARVIAPELVSMNGGFVRDVVSLGKANAAISTVFDALEALAKEQQQENRQGYGVYAGFVNVWLAEARKQVEGK